MRLFYGALEWDGDRDRPWDDGADAESWVEIDYEVGADEAKEIFQEPEQAQVLRIRRYLTDGVATRRARST